MAETTLSVTGSRINLCGDPNKSLMEIHVKQTGITSEIVQSSSRPIAPNLKITMSFPTIFLLHHTCCLNRVWHNLRRELRSHSSCIDLVWLVQRVMAVSRDMSCEDGGGGMPVGGYHFLANVEVRVMDETVMVQGGDNNAHRRQQRRHCGIENLKGERFMVVKEKRDLGSCCICLEEMRGFKVLLKLPCGHVFHESCMDKWSHNSNSCPLCRTPFEYIDSTVA